MTSQASTAKPSKPRVTVSESVEAFLETYDQQFKVEILALRQIILGVDPSITEGIKWNVPSFCTSEYFATFNLRGKEGIGIILHLGAKVRDTATTGIAIADPESLLKWLAKDRASVTFSNLKDIDRKRVAFAQIIRQWIKHL